MQGMRGVGQEAGAGLAGPDGSLTTTTSESQTIKKKEKGKLSFQVEPEMEGKSARSQAGPDQVNPGRKGEKRQSSSLDAPNLERIFRVLGGGVATAAENLALHVRLVSYWRNPIPGLSTLI